jgi:trans-aconitate methyltransferase
MGLQFVPDKKGVLSEMRRLLEPGGRVVLNLPGPTPEPFAALADALERHIDAKCAGFVNVVFSLHGEDELRNLMAEAGFEDVDVHTSQRSLRLPAPQDFLWQYIHSTPLAGFVANATEQERAALQDDVGNHWQRFKTDGGMKLELHMTTVHGKT